MKNIFSTIIISILLFNFITNAQNITNTLPANGIFKIKSNQNDFLSIDETSGDLKLFQNIVLSLNPALGTIFKGDKRFIHTYKGSNAGGSNLFIGENAGNFTSGGSGAVQGTFNTGVGTSSLSSLTIGSENSAFGEQTLLKNTSGDGNSAFGNAALTLNTSGFLIQDLVWLHLLQIAQAGTIPLLENFHSILIQLAARIQQWAVILCK